MMWREAFIQDVRFGWRMLRRTPAVSLFAIIAIALGIGINTMVFSLANAVLFKALPVLGADRLVFVGTRTQEGNDRADGLSWAEFQALKSQVRSLTALSGVASTAADLNDDRGFAEALHGTHVTADAFTAMGVTMLAGRTFVESDARPGSPRVLVLSERVWRSRYNSDPDVVGRTVTLNGKPATIIGVAAQAPLIQDGLTGVWTPFIPEPHWNNRTWRRLTVFARLAPDASLRSANAEVAAFAATQAREYPETNRDVPFLVADFRGFALPAKISTLFLVMLGAVAFVLLVACANVANLMLARAAGRTREIAVRTAIGAARSRIIRQLLVESLLLSVAGGTLGLLIASTGVRLFDLAVPQTDKPLWLDFSVDVRVLVYLMAIVIATTILFGLAPAWRLSKVQTSAELKEGTPGAGRRRSRLVMSTLVVAELSLAVILLAGAGVMIRSFLNVYRVPLGFEREHLNTFRLNTARYYEDAADRARAFADLVARLEAIPGVEAAAVSSSLPLHRSSYDLPVDVGAGASGPLTTTMVVGTHGGYDRAVGAPVREGRYLQAADATPRPTVAVVNEAFAARAWPGQSAIGQQFRLGGREPVWLTVVGVMPDVAQRERGLHRPVAYVPYPLAPQTDVGFVVRSATARVALFPTIRETVRAFNPNLAILDLDTFENQFELRHWPERVFGALFTTFGAIALLLASVGLYGVTSYAASQRTHEIGIRVALGATRRHVTWNIAAGSIKQVTVALLLGLAGSAALTRLLSAQLVDVSPNDPTTFVGVAVVLTTTAIAGCLLPVRRALRVNPVEALRHE